MKTMDLKKLEVKNKRVLVRVDLNIPVKGGSLFRLEAILPTLRYLIKKKAKIILISHLGRPNGRVVESLRLDKISKELSRLLKKKIDKVDSVIGDEVESYLNQMKPGQILMLENVRFHPGEEKNSVPFAKKLAQLGEVFVNEAFSASHRKQASIIGLPKYLPTAIGFLFQKELKELDKIIHQPKRPLVVIIGGAKIKTKIKFIKEFTKKADKLLLGGAIPNTIFASQGLAMGQSLVEKKMFSAVEKLDLGSNKLLLPTSFICQGAEIRTCGVNNIGPDEKILDIGPEGVKLFLKNLVGAKMVVWNGPLGLVEKKPFDRASAVVAKAIIQSKAYSIIGGGETIAFVRKLGLAQKFNYLSTGGGAMLDYLIHGTLPGLEALK